MADITLDQLRQIMPHLASDKASFYLPYINTAMNWGGIDTPQRQAAFLAQGAHESGECRFFHELWGPTTQQLKYEPVTNVSEMLGNTQKGDGFAFRGHGFFQITGRYNHTSAGSAMGADFVNHPELAETPDWAFKVGVWFWNMKHLNDLADIGTEIAFETMTRRINGGLTGLQSRLVYWAWAKKALGIQS